MNPTGKQLEIQYLDISTLTPYEHNCKIHTPQQIKHIAASIEQFGFNDPLGIWGPQNVILEGNGRLEALKLLGITTAPCIRLDHMGDDERRAYIIAHNHLNLETGFDEGALLEQLQQLQDSVNLESLGIEVESYQSQLKQLERKELKPYAQVHYLISMDINIHDRAVGLLDSLREMEGIEVESSLG